MFSGLNYVDWSEKIQFQPSVMDLNTILIIDEKSTTITENIIDDEMYLFKVWERSYKLSLNLMKIIMSENVKLYIPKTENARKFMENMKDYTNSEINSKFIVENLMSELTTKKFE